jgi:hypothetical protein
VTGADAIDWGYAEATYTNPLFEGTTTKPSPVRSKIPVRHQSVRCAAVLLEISGDVRILHSDPLVVPTKMETLKKMAVWEISSSPFVWGARDHTNLLRTCVSRHTISVVDIRKTYGYNPWPYVDTATLVDDKSTCVIGEGCSYAQARDPSLILKAITELM